MNAKKHTDGPGDQSLWTDGSRLESGRTGASVAWYHPHWKTRKTYLGINKKVFNAELYAMGDALEIALKNGHVRREAIRGQTEPRWTRMHIWMYSQTAIKTLQHMALGLRQ